MQNDYGIRVCRCGIQPSLIYVNSFRDKVQIRCPNCNLKSYQYNTNNKIKAIARWNKQFE